MVVERRLRARIDAELARNPAVVLLGPRQVGKTTLAREIAAAHDKAGGAVYLDMERPADVRRLADADAYLRGQGAGKLVVVDEIHRAPELFGVLRGVIDERRRAGDRVGHFLLLGSASLDLMKQSSESLAGRVAYLELGSIDARELPGNVDQLWLRGGFPEGLLAASDADSLSWRQQFIRSYLERDVPMFAPRMPRETVGRLWTMLAHAQGTQLNQSRLATSLAISAPTVGRYIDLLVDLLLVRRLRPWSGNVAKRLVRMPKTYVRDSGIAHALLEVETSNQLLGHPIAGPSWEGFVIETLIAAAGDHRTPSFYRTEDGAEVDLLFERGGEVELAIEIKRSTAPDVSRGFRLAREVLRPKESYVVHAGTGRWTVGDGVAAIGLEELIGRLDDRQEIGGAPR